MPKEKIKRSKRAIPINSELANAIFERRNIETEGDLIIPRVQLEELANKPMYESLLIIEDWFKISGIKY